MAEASVFENGISYEVLSKLDANLVHLVVTSITSQSDYSSFGDYLDTANLVFEQCYRILKHGRIIAVNIPHDKRVDQYAVMSNLLSIIGFEYVNTVCWYKTFHHNNQFDLVAIFKKPLDTSKELEVPFEYGDFHSSKIAPSTIWSIDFRQKKELEGESLPVDIAFKIIEKFTKLGDVVADPLTTHGSVGVAAKNLKRSYLLVQEDTVKYKASMERIASQNLVLDL